MEGISATVYTRMKRYWKRQAYHRIGSSSAASIRIRQVELGGGRRRRRRWGIKIKPKPKLKLKFMEKLASPKKFFIWLRDAYIRMMLGFASSASGGMVCAAGYGGGIGDGISSFGRNAVKEYDEKMILEIYKSLVLAQSNRHEIVGPAPNRFRASPPAAAKLAAIVE